MPSKSTYQCAQLAAATPVRMANGSHITRQRRERQPIANSSTVAVTACATGGAYRCSNDTPWR